MREYGEGHPTGRVKSRGWGEGGVEEGATYGGVAAPEVNPRIGDGIAGVDVDDLDREAHVDSRLTIRDVPADLLATDI